MERQSTGIEWNELLPILLGYPSDSLHATLVMRGDGDSDVRYEVWRQGRKLRVEKDGSPDYICDGGTTWSFEEATGVQGSDGRPVASDARKAVYCGPAQGLCAPRRSSDWQGSDFTTPEGPVTVEEFQGRDCWTVALKAPPRKAGPLRMWVDRDSGYPLGEVNESSEAGGAMDDGSNRRKSAFPSMIRCSPGMGLPSGKLSSKIRDARGGKHWKSPRCSGSGKRFWRPG